MKWNKILNLNIPKAIDFMINFTENFYFKKYKRCYKFQIFINKTIIFVPELQSEFTSGKYGKLHFLKE